MKTQTFHAITFTLELRQHFIHFDYTECKKIVLSVLELEMIYFFYSNVISEMYHTAVRGAAPCLAVFEAAGREIQRM